MGMLGELRRKQSQIDSGYKLDRIASATRRIERAEIARRKATGSCGDVHYLQSRRGSLNRV
jgi:hypothetical protein